MAAVMCRALDPRKCYGGFRQERRAVKAEWPDMDGKGHGHERNLSGTARRMQEPGLLDVLVAGAGYVGLASCRGDLKQARPSLAVAVVDAAPAGVWQRTAAPRRSPPPPAACSNSSVWNEIAPEAQAITDMIITDSRTADPVRPVFLTFDGEVAPGEPFAHMVANKDAERRLAPPRAELGIDVIEGLAVSAFDTEAPASPSIWPTARR